MIARLGVRLPASPSYLLHVSCHSSSSPFPLADTAPSSLPSVLLSPKTPTSPTITSHDHHHFSTNTLPSIPSSSSKNATTSSVISCGPHTYTTVSSLSSAGPSAFLKSCFLIRPPLKNTPELASSSSGAEVEWKGELRKSSNIQSPRG